MKSTGRGEGIKTTYSTLAQQQEHICTAVAPNQLTGYPPDGRRVQHLQAYRPDKRTKNERATTGSPLLLTVCYIGDRYKNHSPKSSTDRSK